MNKLKINLLSEIGSDNIDYAAENNAAIEMTEARCARAKVVMKLLKYMRDNGLKQNDLAEKLSVSPQYINKLLRAQTNIGIETAVHYGNILGITLVVIPDEDQSRVLENIIHKTVYVEMPTSVINWSISGVAYNHSKIILPATNNYIQYGCAR